MGRVRCSYVLIAVMLLWGGSSWAGMEESSSRRVVGGPCDYEAYKGQATIISIHRKELPDNYGGPAYEKYEVKFTFHPNEAIQERHGRIEGGEPLLLLQNSWYPGPRFLQKYGIAEGKRFDCYLKVITRGTCTPIIFDFPTIDLADYFENRE